MSRSSQISEVSNKAGDVKPNFFPGKGKTFKLPDVRLIKSLFAIWNRSAYPALVLSAILAVCFFFQLHRLVRNEDWLDHSDRAIGRAILLQKLMLDAETGVRGFLLSGEDVTFNPFREQQAVFDRTLEDARTLVDDNAAQVKRLDGIKVTFGKWVTRANSIQSKATDPETRSFFGVGEGRQLMDICRRYIDAFLTDEQSLRETRAARLRIEIPRAIASGAAITLLLRVLGIFLIRHLKRAS